MSSYWTDARCDFITSQPGAWLRLMATQDRAARNAAEMLDTESQETYAEWSLPLRRSGPVAHFGVLVPLAVLRPRRRPWPHAIAALVCFYAMLVAYAASVVVFYVFARYRYPLVPLLILFAAPAVAAAFRRWLRQRRGA